MAEEKKKKGFFSAIKESMNKSGGCCGAGETCDCRLPHRARTSPKRRKRPLRKSELDIGDCLARALRYGMSFSEILR